jgi:hypothetical protein
VTPVQGVKSELTEGVAVVAAAVVVVAMVFELVLDSDAQLLDVL